MSAAKTRSFGAIIGKNNLSMRIVVHVQYNNMIGFTIRPRKGVCVHFDPIWIKPARPIYSVIHLSRVAKKNSGHFFSTSLINEQHWSFANYEDYQLHGKIRKKLSKRD